MNITTLKSKKRVLALIALFLLILDCSCATDKKNKETVTEDINEYSTAEVETETETADRSSSGYTLQDSPSLNNSVTNESYKYSSLEDMINKITKKTEPAAGSD